MPLSRKEYFYNLNKSIAKAKKTRFLLEATIISKGCCRECENIFPKTIPFEDVLKKKPLSNQNCTRNSVCICSYGFHALRDMDGKIIKVKRWWERIFN